jgi:hypothetical protein
VTNEGAAEEKAALDYYLGLAFYHLRHQLGQDGLFREVLGADHDPVAASTTTGCGEADSA